MASGRTLLGRVCRALSKPPPSDTLALGFDGRISTMAGYRGAFLAAGLMAACLVAPQSGFSAAAGGGFTVTSSAFADGGMLTVRHAADDPMRMCGGQNISPPLQWSNVSGGHQELRPCSARSRWTARPGRRALDRLWDPRQRHVVAEGEMTKQSEKFVGGKGTRNNAMYIGPCPPVGDALHHYVFTVIATDLEPTALKAGLTRDELYDRDPRSRQRRHQHRRTLRALNLLDAKRARAQSACGPFVYALRS